VRPIVFALFALLFTSLASAQTFSSLEERMSAAEFRAAGLDKLSPEELQRLNDWLRDSAGRAVMAAPQEDRRGLPQSRTSGSNDPIVSRVLGEFRGWSGQGDRIELENGQVWEVIDSFTRLAVRLQNPTISVEPGFMDGWFLSVEGYGTRARVKRVR
jgi:hypothetical protein